MGWLSDPEERDYSEYDIDPGCLICGKEMPEPGEYTCNGFEFCGPDCHNAYIVQQIWGTHLHLLHQGWFFRRNVHYAVGVSSAGAPWNHDALLMATIAASRGRAKLEQLAESEAA